ncbi:MAG: methionyl-tRNA formyltransferase [Clostridia bacterium]|nr:methionyl-tRNA formyltransferase [Clostridia bacterium]
MMKIVFLGSDIAIPVFEKLINSKHQILAVVCQPDKPNKRNNKIEFCELKKLALSKNIPVLQYNKIRLEGVFDLKALKPDLLISAAYGQIISQEIIDIPVVTTLNVHPSLLPKYRGPSPIITPILNGDEKTGVAIMQMVFEFDKGPIFDLKQVEIMPEETAGELSARLFTLGGEMLLEVIEKLENGTAKKYEQDENSATYCHMIDKNMAKIDFNKKAYEIKNLVRAFNPTPVAYFEYQNLNFKVFKCDILLENTDEYNKICSFVNKNNFKNGEVVTSKNKVGLVIKCKDGFILPKLIQAPNGKVMEISAYLNGKSFEVGYII